LIFGSFHQGKEHEKSKTALSIFNAIIYNPKKTGAASS